MLWKADSGYRKYVREREEAAQEETFRKQGAVLAEALAPRFDAAIASASAAGVATAAASSAFPPAPPAPGGSSSTAAPPAPTPPSSSGAFTPEQLAQLKDLLGVVPPGVETKRGPGRPPKAGAEEEPHGAAAPLTPVAGTLSALQRVFVKSHFGGKISLTEGTFEEFQTQIDKKWTQKAIPDGLNSFIKEHQPRIAVPKSKAERMRLFWSTLQGLD